MLDFLCGLYLNKQLQFTVDFICRKMELIRYLSLIEMTRPKH